MSKSSPPSPHPQERAPGPKAAQGAQQQHGCREELKEMLRYKDQPEPGMFREGKSNSIQNHKITNCNSI